MYLLDTNVLVLAIKGEPLESKFLRSAVKKNNVCISVLCVAEYLVKPNDEELEIFESLLVQSRVIVIDEEVARQAAIYRKESLKKSKVALLDCMLAGQAKVHNLILVTNDKSGFPMKDIEVISPN